MGDYQVDVIPRSFGMLNLHYSKDQNQSKMGDGDFEENEIITSMVDYHGSGADDEVNSFNNNVNIKELYLKL